MAKIRELLLKKQFHYFIIQNVCWMMLFLYTHLFSFPTQNLSSTITTVLFIVMVLIKNIITFKLMFNKKKFIVFVVFSELITIISWCAIYILFLPYDNTGLIFVSIFIALYLHLKIDNERLRVIVDSTIIVILSAALMFFIPMSIGSLIFFLIFEFFVYSFLLIIYLSLYRSRLLYLSQLGSTTRKLPGVILQIEMDKNNIFDLTFVSQNMKEFTGYEVGDIQELSSLEKIIGKDNWKTIKQEIVRKSTESDSFSIEFYDLKRDCWYRLYLSIIKKNYDHLVFNGLLINIDEIKMKEKALVQSKKAAEQGAEAKSNFLANMSHELRTPLNGVIGMTDLMMSTNLDEEQKEYAETVKTSGETLLTIINDVLDYSKLEAGRLKIAEIPFDLKKSIYSVLDILRPAALDKDLDLMIEIDSRIPEKVVGDQSRIKQIMFNLIGNAIKFTQKGYIKVSAKIVRDHMKGNGADLTTDIRFEVEDTGIGISEADLPFIFEKFTQVDDTFSRSYGGTGLGLAISRELISIMGGKLEVSSMVKQGSSFHFILPYGLEDDIINPFNDHNETKEYDTKSVLLVEDNDINQNVLGRLLEKLNCHVTIVDNGELAIETVRQQMFDLIFMDCQMPGMDGLQATKIIRKELNIDYIPIIALTGHAMPGDRDRFIKAGMDDYLCKPVKSSDLKSMISKWSPREVNK